MHYRTLHYKRYFTARARIIGMSMACFGVACLLAGCTDFLEKSIAHSKPELLSPGDGAETNTYAISFMWEPLDFALDYRLQVASPSFDSVAFFYADTTTAKTQFVASLAPGKYQWRVMARNGSSQTSFTTQSFTIHESALSTQTVLQRHPPNNFATASGRVILDWQGIFSATRYRVQVGASAFPNDGQWVIDSLVSMAPFEYELPAEGRYHWRVSAENDTATSKWSAIRTMVSDTTPPSAPRLSTPADKENVNRPVDLQWELIDDAVAYRLYIYNSDTVLVANYPVRLTGNHAVFNGGNRGGEILWRTKAEDPAGNESEYSVWRSFVIRD